MLDRQTYPDKKVVQFLGQVVPVKLNADIAKNGKLGEKYGASALPTIAVIDANGKLLGKFIGFMPPAEFIKNVKRFMPAGRSK
jgi:thioredoxin-related protein